MSNHRRLNHPRYPTGSRPPSSFSSSSSNHSGTGRYYNFSTYHYSNTSSVPNASSSYSSLYGRLYDQSAVAFQRLLTLSSTTIADLAEPLSLFDEIEPSRQRRSVISSPLPSEYILPEPGILPLLNNIHRNRADVFREQLFTEVQNSIHDVERNLALLERRPSTSRHLPSRLLPLRAANNQDDYAPRRTLTPMTPIPPITSSIYEQEPSTLTAGNANENAPRSSRSKPICNATPSLSSDSIRTTKQSIPGQQTKRKPSLRDQLLHDTDRGESDREDKPQMNELEEAVLRETLEADQFLHDLMNPSQTSVTFPVMGLCKLSDDMLTNDGVLTDIDLLATTTFLNDLTATHRSLDDDIESLIQTRSDASIESELNYLTMFDDTTLPEEFLPTNTVDRTHLDRAEDSPTSTDPRPSTRGSNSVLRTADDFPEKLLASRTAASDPVATTPTLAVRLSIDSETSSRAIPHGRNDDATRNRSMNHSHLPPTVLFSGHVSQEPRQQWYTSSIPSTKGTNNQRVTTEKSEEVRRKKIDPTKKSIVTTISILPASPSSLQRALPAAIVDNVQTQSTPENNRNNDNYKRKPLYTTFNADAVHESGEEQVGRAYNSHNRLPGSVSLIFQMQSRIQAGTVSSISRASLKNVADEGIATPERINSADQDMKPGSRSLSRSTSSARSSLNDVDGNKSASRTSVARRSSMAATEQPHSHRQKSTSSSSSSARRASARKSGADEDEEGFPDERIETPQEFDQRSLSDQSVSQLGESGLSSSASSAVPVNLDSSDIENNEIPVLKTTSPKKEHSVSPSRTPRDQEPSADRSVKPHSDRLSPRKSNEHVASSKNNEPRQTATDRPGHTHELPTLGAKHTTNTHASTALLKSDNSESNHKRDRTLSRQSTPVLSSMHPPSVPDNDLKDRHHQMRSDLPAKSEYVDVASPSVSPLHHEFGDTDPTSNGGGGASTMIPHRGKIKAPTNHNSTDHTHLRATHPTSRLSPVQPTFATEIHRPSSERSVSSPNAQHGLHHDEHPQHSTTNHSKVSHREQKRARSGHSSPLPEIEARSVTPIKHNDDLQEPKSEERHRRRRVSFSSSTGHSLIEEQHVDGNWRERVASILASKHQPNEKYAYVQARVNSFENFEYHPRRFNITPKRTPRSKQPDHEENETSDQNGHRSKRPVDRKIWLVHERIGDEQCVHPVKELPVQMFGRLLFLADGSPTIFHEPLEWHASSRLKEYLYENFHYTPRRHEVKISDKKPRWHSESKLSDFAKESPRFFQRDALAPASSLPLISDTDQPHFAQQQFDRRLQHRFPNKRSNGSKSLNRPIAEEEHRRADEYEPEQHQSKPPKVQVSHQAPQWSGVPKFRMRSPLRVHPSRTTLSNGQIFNEKLNWNARSKVHCWSEIDLRQLAKKKAALTQYSHPNQNHPMPSPIYPPHHTQLKVAKPTKTHSDGPARPRDSLLKGYVWENYNYKSTRPNYKLRHVNTPPRKAKWNAVSKTRSVNSNYNPKVKHSDTARRGGDQEVRRKRVNKLPPLKRKRESDQLAELPSTDQLAIDYNYDRSPTTQKHGNQTEYARTSSRRSSKALVPINHHQRFPDLELPTETPRSHRPIQQEWYDDMNKSLLTHRTDADGSISHSFLHSVTPVYQSTTPRDQLPYRSTPRNSQNSGVSGTLLDSSIRTNRATEIRLAKDMDEHHQHCHHVSQSMPLEIRGFELEGTQCTVPVDATIRPLSNVNYRASERVKNHRLYPWSMLHPHGTSSRNSSLVPIAEFHRPSLDSTITENHQS